ncbi:metallophosphoesterase [Sorangium sp. So ce1335]|uniref:metallophosphoesterase n=1 Tax=Sorangium sp. So ce1335 TaxID=3133335 RepID=UPI003F5D94EB
MHPARATRPSHAEIARPRSKAMDGAARDIFVISDLHIGDGGARDNFESGKKTPELRAFLDHVGSEGGELFLLGDVFELWQMNLSLLLVKRRALLDQLASLPLVYVPGNHDVDLLHFIDTDFLHHPFFACMRAPFGRELGGRRFRFCHGHESDPFNAGNDPGFGRMLSIFAGLFEDQNGSPVLRSGESVEDVLEQFGDSMLTIWKHALATVSQRGARGEARGDVRPGSALTPVQSPGRLGEHVVGVRAELERGDHDVAVLGHTHKAGRIGDWYFNSGAWAGPLNSFLRISPDGHVRYLEWKDGRAVEREMPVVLPGAKPGGAPRPAKNPVAAARSAVRALFPRPTRPERSRWILIAQGALAISVGAGALTISVGHGASAGWRLLVSAFAAYALLDGALSLVGASREPPVRRLLSLVRGVASVLLGLLVLRRGHVVEIFVILAGISAFIAGALRVAASVVLKGMVESRWLFAAGAGAMLAGLVLLAMPASAVLLKLVLAGYLCYYGAGELMAGIFGQRLPRAAGSRALA